MFVSTTAAGCLLPRPYSSRPGLWHSPPHMSLPYTTSSLTCGRPAKPAEAAQRAAPLAQPTHDKPTGKTSSARQQPHLRAHPLQNSPAANSQPTLCGVLACGPPSRAPIHSPYLLHTCNPPTCSTPHCGTGTCDPPTLQCAPLQHTHLQPSSDSPPAHPPARLSAAPTCSPAVIHPLPTFQRACPQHPPAAPPVQPPPQSPLFIRGSHCSAPTCGAKSARSASNPYDSSRSASSSTSICAQQAAARLWRMHGSGGHRACLAPASRRLWQAGCEMPVCQRLETHKPNQASFSSLPDHLQLQKESSIRPRFGLDLGWGLASS